MTDNEVIKALECCINDDCDNCPDTFGNCEHNAMRNALNLINRQQEEIEKLQKVNDSFTDIGKLYSEIKVEAVKEFADRLQIRCIKQDGCLWSSDIGAELKEMVCEENGKY